MTVNIQQKINVDRKLFLLIFLITFTIFLFTSDAHRYSIDEGVAQEQTIRLITLEDNILYEDGVSALGYEYGDLFAIHDQPLCGHSLLCTSAYIGHSIVQYPFVFINHNLNIITESTVIFSDDDFDDPHYVWWRNSLNSDFTFMELTFGPFFSALSVGVFFLVCRTYNFKTNNSILIAFLYAFTTSVWAYSQTSLNSVPMTFFVLLGFLFLRKFQNTSSPSFVLFCAGSFGFAFLIRPDTILFIIPITIFLILHFWKQNNKIKNLISFFTPLLLCYAVYHYVQSLRFSDISTGLVETTTSFVSRGHNYDYFLDGLFGLFLSPGVGLLIFSPILLSIFFSFPDFFSKHKKDCLLFLSIIFYFIYTYSTVGDTWHGLSAWSARYFIPIIPFLLLPLAASFEQRKNKYLTISLLSAGAFGIFTNIIYVIQDVSWFVWGLMGSDRGLYALGTYETPLRIHALTLWTFEYSPLTQSAITGITNLNLDIYLVKLFGIPIFISILIVIILPLCFLLYHTKNKITE
jgi:hypothetical protein